MVIAINLNFKIAKKYFSVPRISKNFRIDSNLRKIGKWSDRIDFILRSTFFSNGIRVLSS